jgi:hypothetical protein
MKTQQTQYKIVATEGTRKFPYFDPLSGKELIGTKKEVSMTMVLLMSQYPQYTYTIESIN